MTCPWFLRVAFFLGINPYAQILSLKFNKACGVLLMLYVMMIAIQVIYTVLGSDLSSVVIFAIMFRSSTTCFFILTELIDSHATYAFYDEILALIDSSSRNKIYTSQDVWCLALILMVIPEDATLLEAEPVTLLMYSGSVVMNTLTPIFNMLQFSLCCSAVQSSYLRLREDLLRSGPRTSSYTLRRLRVRQLDIGDHVRNISSTFGLRLFLYTLMIQLILLEKIDFLVNRIASRFCDYEFLMVLGVVCGYLVNLWYFSYRPFQATCQHQKFLATIMDMETADMDVSAMHDMALLAEDMTFRKVQFSAAGCFYVGFHIFYGVIGILFSYIMIVGPLAYNKQRHLWVEDGE